MNLSIFLIPLSLFVIISYAQQFKYLFFKNDISNINYTENDFIYGFFFLTSISYFLNFLFPLKYFSLGIYIYGLVSFFFLKIFKKIIITINLNLLLLTTITLIIVSFNNELLYDSKLYHYQILKHNFEEKIIFGLVNIDPRLAFSSSWHQLISIFGFNYDLMSNFSIILYSFILNIILAKNFFLKKISRIFLLCFTGFIIFYSLIHPMLNGIVLMSIGSPEVDTIGMLLLAFSIYLFLDNKSNKYQIILSALLCLTAKLSYIGLGLLILFINHKKYELIKYKSLYLVLIFFIISFFLKSFIQSSCLIFPVVQTCLDTTWSLKIDNIIYINEILQNWAKDQPYRKLYTYPEYFNDLRWFKSWLFNYFLQTSYVQILIFIFFLTLVILFFYNKLFIKFFKTKKVITTLIILIIIFLIWFQAPAVRYGFGVLLSIPLILLSISLMLIKKNFLKIIFDRKIYLIFLLLLLSKNILNFDLMFNQRLSILSENNLSNYKEFINIINIKEKRTNILYSSKSADNFCYNLKQPCTTFTKFIENHSIYLNTRYGYKFYSLNYSGI